MASEGEYRGIQALRGAAALLVVAFHALEAWNTRSGLKPVMWPNGAAGVDIFFVISGFVMTLSTQRLGKPRQTWRRFAMHRLRRIVPLYWICSAAKVAAVAGAPALALHTKLTIGYVAASFLFLPVHDQNGAFRPVLPVGWTLSFEMLFYALFAAGLKLRMASPLLLIPPLVVLTWLPHAPASVASELCNPILLEFGFGIVVAVGVERGWILPPRLALALLAGASCALLLVPHDVAAGRVLPWGVPAALIVAGVASLEPSASRIIPRALLRLGDASYALYLSHGFVIAALAPVLAREAGAGCLAWVACASLASALAGYALHVRVEKPVLQALRTPGKTQGGLQPASRAIASAMAPCGSATAATTGSRRSTMERASSIKRPSPSP